MRSLNGPLPTAHRPLLAWHGWHLTLPPEWSPVRIEGDRRKGSMMIADFHATRLALRWDTINPRRFDAEAWSQRVIGGEVGQLMLERSTQHVPGDLWSAGRLFLEPEPPGRDVWAGHSRVSGRVLEIVYPCKARSRALPDEIVAGVVDVPADAPQTWSVFDLTCTVPAGWALQSHRLNAGDLTLTFARGRETLIVRQVGPASLALARQPLEKWLDGQRVIWKKFYRSSSGPFSLWERARVRADDAARCGGSSELPSTQRPHPSPLPEGEGAATRVLQRRRRFFYLRHLSYQRHTLALHDVARDRIVLIDAGSESLARETVATVGQRSVVV